MLDQVLHPLAQPWWSDARCRGAGADALIVERGGARTAPQLRRRFCAQCPTAGRCLEDAVGMPLELAAAGPMRCGLSGQRSHSAARSIVASWEPSTSEDWDVLAAWLLDDRDEALSA